MRKKASRGVMIIRARHQDSAAFMWFYRSPEGRCYEGSLNATVLPKKLFRESRVVFLMPASRLLFCDVAAVNVKAPSLNALIWQIESELLTEAESLHGVILGCDNDRYSIAAVETSLFVQWLERLRQDGIVPDAVYPDIMALSCGTAVRLGDEWLIRYSPTRGFSAREEHLAVLWEKVESVPVHCFSTPAPDIREWKAMPARAASALFNIDIPQKYSFLTKKFQPEIAITQLPGFRALLIGAAFSALSLSALPFYEAYLVGQQARQLENEARKRVKSYFPQLPDQAALRPWLEQKLSLAATSQASQGLNAMLADSYGLLAKIKQGNIEKLEWDSERQTLVFIIADAQPDLASLATTFSTQVLITQVVPQRRNRVQLVIKRK